MRLWYSLLCSLLMLSGCGHRVPIPGKGKFKDWSTAAIQADQITFDFILWLTWAGMACVVVGVIWLLWGTRKDVGIRVIFTGFAFNLVAKAITFYETYEWLVWLCIFACVVIYCLLNPRRVEKVLAKLHIFVDIDGDGMIGTGRTARKAGKRKWWIFREKTQDEIPTEKILSDHSVEET